MGATVFETIVLVSDAETPEAAYRLARERARDRNGHRDGYSGDIQTTHSFTLVTPRDGETIRQLVDRIIDDSGSTGIDKWEAAGCVKVDATDKRPAHWLFFGWGAE